MRHLAYRGRVLIWFIVDGLQVLVFPFIWLHVYGDRTTLHGFSRADIVGYYVVLTYLNIVATGHISRIIRADIMQGDLNSHLVRPLNYFFFRAFHELSYHLIYLPFTTLLLVALTWQFPQLVSRPAAAVTWVLFAVAVVLSFILSLCLEVLVGLGTFWLKETAGLGQLKSLLEAVFSGSLAPLAFYPLILQKVAGFLPFQYLIWFPLQIYLNKLTPLALWSGFFSIALWLVFLGLLIVLVWRRGLRQYEGAGI